MSSDILVIFNFLPFIVIVLPALWVICVVFACVLTKKFIKQLYFESVTGDVQSWNPDTKQALIYYDYNGESYAGYMKSNTCRAGDRVSVYCNTRNFNEVISYKIPLPLICLLWVLSFLPFIMLAITIMLNFITL